MKIERTKNAAKNIIFGMILKVYQIVVPFLMRTAIIYTLGVQYLGLDSLFISVLQILNLAELGVGSAMVFSMYKPIAEDDEMKICALMKLYKIYYRVIGIIILVIGLIISPFIPYLIKSDLPIGLNIYVLYIMNLLATVFSYWLFAYKNCLLQAHQRNDITSKVTLCVFSIKYLIQFVVLFCLKNYYYYLMVNLISQMLLNVITAIIVSKLYPNYEARGKLDKEIVKDINQRVKDLFTSKVGGVIVNSVDTVVISAFLGLTMLAIYQNYYYIITAIIGLVGVIFTSCSAGIGNSLVIDSEEKNYNDLKKFTFIIIWVSSFCTCCLLCLFQPFMKWWVGEKFLLSFSCVICLCVYYYMYELNFLLNTYKDSAGIWHKDRFRPLATAFTNLILNLLLVNFIGIYGIILSTVISMLIVGIPWLLHNLFYEVFKRSAKDYIIQLLKYTTTMVMMAMASYWLCSFIDGYTLSSLIIRGIICGIVTNIIWILTYRKSEEMNGIIKIANRVIKKKIDGGVV